MHHLSGGIWVVAQCQCREPGNSLAHCFGAFKTKQTCTAGNACALEVLDQFPVEVTGQCEDLPSM